MESVYVQIQSHNKYNKWYHTQNTTNGQWAMTLQCLSVAHGNSPHTHVLHPNHLPNRLISRHHASALPLTMCAHISILHRHHLSANRQPCRMLSQATMASMPWQGASSPCDHCQRDAAHVLHTRGTPPLSVAFLGHLRVCRCKCNRSKLIFRVTCSTLHPQWFDSLYVYKLF